MLKTMKSLAIAVLVSVSINVWSDEISEVRELCDSMVKEQFEAEKWSDPSVKFKKLSKLAEQSQGSVADAYRLGALYIALQIRSYDSIVDGLMSLAKQVPADSEAWAHFSDMVPTLVSTLPDYAPETAVAYLEGLRNNPSREVAGHVEIALLANQIKETPISVLDKKFKQLSADFPGHPGLLSLSEWIDAEKKQLKVGGVAPAFDVPDFHNPENRLQLNSFKGKYLLIDFWATWCGPCVKDLPKLQQAYKKYHSQGLDVLSISGDQSAEDLSAFLNGDGFEMPWKHTLDSASEKPMSDAYGVTALPTLFLLDKSGKVVATQDDLRGENLDKTLSKLLAD